ncbi:putative gustatory receptor 28b [Diachasma alloeum]|uniref:Gustatory receptor n=1 Tax=Diachasma alloeum TaxID=454923 RepID=A0A4E0S3V3_9HYME|nr:putative gustatory receptor 28b [Diachasma alloeum]THK33155.1 gustatory receptor 14 [Diachasma alloeum]
MNVKISKISVSSLCVIRLNFLVSRLLGLAPFEFVRSETSLEDKKLKRETLTFRYSRTGAASNLIWMLVVSILHYNFVYTACVEERDDGSLTSKAIGICLAMNGLVLLTFLPLKYLFEQRKIVSFANRLMKIDKSLNELRDVYHLNSGNVRLLLMTVAHLICCLLVLFSESILLQNSAASITIYVGQTVVLTFYITQYALVVTLMEKRFASLNDALLRISTNNVRTYTLTASQRSLNRSVTVEVMIIKRAYVILSDMCREIADFYAAATIFIVIHFSTSIMYSSYLMIITPMIKTWGIGVFLDYVNTGFWLLFELAPLTVLVTSAARASKEMKRTSEVVHRLLATCAASREFRRELKNFSLDLLHRNFKFTAYDMFSLDASLMNSIFSAIATYLVIFLQFQIKNSVYMRDEMTTTAISHLDSDVTSLP